MSAAREEAAQVGLADAVADDLAGAQPPLPDLGLPAFATAVATDGRVVRIIAEPDGGMTLQIGGRGHPVRFDRFQARAIGAAFSELPEGGYVFARGAGRAA